MSYFKLAFFSICASLALSGCTTFSKDGGFGDVKQTAAQHVKQEVVWPKTENEQKIVAERVSELLKQQLDADGAVQIALLNNKGLQASFYNLGISEADIVQAGRLPNPKFSMFYARNNGDYKIEQALTFNIFSLIAMPKMLEIERRNFEKTKQAVALEVLQLAYQTRLAYFNAVAANEHLLYSEQVKESAEASAELARRMVQAGNWSKLEQAREQSFYADAMLDYVNAKHQQTSAHETLSRLLGISAEQINLQKRLPDLPKTVAELQLYEKTAFEQRLDLQAMRLETQNLAKQLGLTKITRFINVLEIGPARVLEGKRGDPYKKGVDISFELPLFDWGGAKVARAEATYMQAVNRTAQAAFNAQSEIREAYSRYQSSYEMAKHYHDEIVPLRKKILDENQLRYNGMLISPFELFADARAQVASVNAYIEKLNEFWLAETALQMTLTGSASSMEGK
ncbi:TolC family protein [Methylotenera sp.]|uniref:TolC family protein n=1 Tax=Methylotenera sp. TaxID=2051956 RepID=UPI00272FA0CF|nr:TolC family protein [Methylotenera sp.]MDP1523085.1 TolC family protein [Methylotenera sp.]MDP2072048.1 TolC family protein [Methylotenera sp.]MDP3006942.1 TolC family protein [Methylotenera sp.]MDP3007121.1 TolC family protein [Methylotenera sp.]MDP3306922.1 TolC family protein [Methylotenera sp.]